MYATHEQVVIVEEMPGGEMICFFIAHQVFSSDPSFLIIERLVCEDGTDVYIRILRVARNPECCHKNPQRNLKEFRCQEFPRNCVCNYI